MALEVLAPPGQTHELLIRRTEGDAGGPEFRISLAVPINENGLLREPLITALSNNAYRTPAPLADVGNPIRVYDGYLRISGNHVVPDSRLRFILFRQTDSHNEFLGTSDARLLGSLASSGVWICIGRRKRFPVFTPMATPLSTRSSTACGFLRKPFSRNLMCEA